MFDFPSNPYPLIAVAGPTGAGKSDLALRLAAAFGGEIVNCDSVQVYRGLDVGSAKTPLAARAGIPHHLIDVVPPTAELTAGAYARLATQALHEIRERGTLPILCGGTGFYLRALLHGLSPAPPGDPELRTRLNAVAPAVAHRFLRLRDPDAARRIHPNDRQKLIRAVELAGQRRAPRQPLEGFRVLKLVLHPERAPLNARLDTRSAEMFDHGLLAETQALLEAGVSPDAKSLQALGYRQAVAVIARQISLADAIAECQLKTRQYAKRQITWFRSEPGVTWISGFGFDPDVQAEALRQLREFVAA